MSSRLAEAAFESAAVIGFKNSQGGVKQLAFRYDDHIETWRDLIMTEHLSYQPFSTVPSDRATELFRGGYSQPSDIKLIGQDEERAVTTVDAGTLLISLLKICATPDPLAGAQLHSSQLAAYTYQLCRNRGAESWEPTAGSSQLIADS